MQINDDGAEIDSADYLSVYGQWIKFRDDQGAVIKIDPIVVRKLFQFMQENEAQFDWGSE